MGAVQLALIEFHINALVAESVKAADLGSAWRNPEEDQNLSSANLFFPVN